MPGRTGQYGSWQGRIWPKERASWLKHNPWCVICAKLGQRVKATDVDHIVRHKGISDPLFWDKRNWRSLCSLHHKQKSGREAHGMAEEMGCDAAGLPKSPDHPWNR